MIEVLGYLVSYLHNLRWSGYKYEHFIREYRKLNGAVIHTQRIVDEEERGQRELRSHQEAVAWKDLLETNVNNSVNIMEGLLYGSVFIDRESKLKRLFNKERNLISRAGEVLNRHRELYCLS